MRALLCAPLVLAAFTWAGCGDGATTLRLEIDGPPELTSIDVSVSLPDSGSTSEKLPLGSGKRTLPGSLIVILPDRAVDVTLDVVGHQPAGDLSAHTVVTSRPHEEVRVPIHLGEPGADLAVSDLGGDLGVGDLSGDDLAAPDLSTEDLVTVPSMPTPRLISSSYFSNYSGTTYKSPSTMTQTHFVVDTTGVSDGDLLILVGNVDNGSDTVWPTPIAPGFQQLAQTYFGSDGQTYFVAWKIANGEPASYSGDYGSGQGSGSAVLSLIAVRGANRTTPINAFLAGNGTAGASPTPAASSGVTTTVANCALIYAAGSDWLGSPGSNTFTVPSGYTSLAQLGDRGDANWDWTSQMVAWSRQSSPGVTGSISGTLTSSTMGIGWTAVIAVAPQ